MSGSASSDCHRVSAGGSLWLFIFCASQSLPPRSVSPLATFAQVILLWLTCPARSNFPQSSFTARIFPSLPAPIVRIPVCRKSFFPLGFFNALRHHQVIRCLRIFFVHVLLPLLRLSNRFSVAAPRRRPPLQSCSKPSLPRKEFVRILSLRIVIYCIL
jgi:hypothetical protein